MPLSPLSEDAIQTLAVSHREQTKNEYGRPIVGGFSVADGLGGTARVSHTIVEPDLLNPDRPTDDELTDARHRMVIAYAETLERGGWTVRRRRMDSRRPYLLATR